MQEAAEGLGADSSSDDSDDSGEEVERKKASAVEGLIETVRRPSALPVSRFYCAGAHLEGAAV
eukprot:COSAG02_NODE_2068_length_9943_cov_5.977245_7_plen_63_part_00